MTLKSSRVASSIGSSRGLLSLRFRVRVPGDPRPSHAGVAELAQAPDLGSGGFAHCGFESHRPHRRKRRLREKPLVITRGFPRQAWDSSARLLRLVVHECDVIIDSLLPQSDRIIGLARQICFLVQHFKVFRMVLPNPILERPPHRPAELREVEAHEGISHQTILDDKLKGMPAEWSQSDLVGTKTVSFIVTADLYPRTRPRRFAALAD